MDLGAAACCGDYCGKCSRFPAECRGCIPASHPECDFVKCCKAKEIEHCGLCRDFPCSRLREFVPDDRPECPPGYHVENLRARKKLGTKAWLESQRALWGR